MAMYEIRGEGDDGESNGNRVGVAGERELVDAGTGGTELSLPSTSSSSCVSLGLQNTRTHN